METSEHINAATRKVEERDGVVSQEGGGKRNKKMKEREQQSTEMVQFGEEQQRDQSADGYVLEGDPELWQEFEEEDF